ncbi:MAG: hypothetical protein HXX08_13110 [Chloroflexi bacterium]|uniref:DUF3147 family protein n=1 Tax=Candidatus Chlorohelix allophototropha TaxID=3003348 RepID=A0A8T7M3Z5_9CHLR|nr:hypothetical protein [Chloroflexota bacterium]WJW70206.1 hypothetical protein OZ401_004723 [Chloroflexota bacterium L227-S17]
MIALKLVLTPLLVGFISLAGRKWGSRVSGWLIGLPLTSAPVTLFLAYEQGTTFAAKVAQGILFGLISQTLFCVAYSWLSFRWSWLACWLSGWGLFFIATLCFEQINVPYPLAFVSVNTAIIIGLLILPKPKGAVVEAKAPAWEIAARMLIATGLVLTLTTAAPALGSQLSGLLSPLPVYATIFAIFTQRFQSQEATLLVLRGVLVSSFACAVFFLVVILAIQNWGILAAFLVATLAAIVTQGAALRLSRPSLSIK